MWPWFHLFDMLRDTIVVGISVTRISPLCACTCHERNVMFARSGFRMPRHSDLQIAEET